MEKYVWHSVQDELPPSDAPMLILMVKHIYQNENDYERYMRLGFYAPAFGKRAWRDEFNEPLEHGDWYIVTHWTYAPKEPKMDGFEALTEAMNQCAASAEHFANAVRQSETQCGCIKQKHN